jgi:hypothetical protein
LWKWDLAEHERSPLDKPGCRLCAIDFGRFGRRPDYRVWDNLGFFLIRCFGGAHRPLFSWKI